MLAQTITDTRAIAQSGSLGASYVCCLWGENRYLDLFLQAYAVERTRQEAHRKGYSVTEQSLSDGSVKLTVQVGGAA